MPFQVEATLISTRSCPMPAAAYKSIRRCALAMATTVMNCSSWSSADMGLVEIVGDLIEDYESAHHPLPPTIGLQALKFLIEQHGLKQSDLPEVGSQGVVSEILAGKRELNLRQVRALGKRFGVSPATFI